jgi:hypothetical protein
MVDVKMIQYTSDVMAATNKQSKVLHDIVVRLNERGHFQAVADIQDIVREGVEDCHKVAMNMVNLVQESILIEEGKREEGKKEEVKKEEMKTEQKSKKNAPLQDKTPPTQTQEKVPPPKTEPQ